MAIAAQNKEYVYPMDVKTTFVNGYIDEQVYVEQAQGYEVQGQEHKV